ncbi:MAG: aminoglycoside phosphotransferase family protein [Oceanicoccus sp.]
MDKVVSADEMDADWFTRLLQRRGFVGVEVETVRQNQIGTGQIGKCIRFSLSYSGDAGDAPFSLVGKFPSDEPLSRETGVNLRNYYREVEFYRHLADGLSIAIPKCYFTAIVDEGPEFVLLLQDMAPAEPGDQLTGCEPDIARAAVLELVGLQAPSWCDESLRQYDWLLPDENSIDPAEWYGQLLPEFLERYGHALEDDEKRILARVADAPGCPLFQPVTKPFCIEHVDYRLDNMLIDKSGLKPKVTVLDWQSLRIGKPMNDVAYFLGAGLVSKVRAQVEEAIVRDYHQALTAAGIKNYTWTECWEDYRRGSFSGFAVTVIASMIVEQTERGDEMFITMARRHTRHALDLGADEFLNQEQQL